MFRFYRSLLEHRDELNSLNVYPVPDGDTGTNMLLTQQAVRDELTRQSGASLEDVGAGIARSSLMGARGNSGVILAQALRGLVGALMEDGAVGGALALGLRRAADEAYRAVAGPAKGTVLDVLADAAGAAERTASAGADAAGVASAALEGARASLARTKDELTELREAGVVDAGGKGIVLLLDALHAAITGTELSELVGPYGPIGTGGLPKDRSTSDYKWEVQYLLDVDEPGALDSLRAALGEIGDSLIVVGGGGTYKVHVHTNDREQAVELARDVGAPSAVSVVDLESDVERCMAGQARGIRPIEQQATALVAVAGGEGLEGILASLGAEVVRGGPGHDPSVGDLLEAIRAAPSQAVIVLPNHRNVIPAAERAAGESSMDVRVVPTESIPQGVAAAAAFHPDATIDENEKALREASEGCAWGEVARAVRDADTPAGHVQEGEYLGFARDRAVLARPDPATIAVDLVGMLREPHHEILTVFTGEGVSDQDAGGLEARLRQRYPDLEVEMARGDQPGYPYLIGIE